MFCFVQIPLLVDDDDDDMFAELARNQGKSRYETPRGPIRGTRWVPPTAASSKKTPVSNIDDSMFEEK